MTSGDGARAIEAYARALENLRPETVDGLADHCAATMEFRDPFNHSRDAAGFLSVMRHMYGTVDGVRFTVLSRSGGGDTWYLKWRFEGRAKIVGELDFTGVSEIGLDADGRVCRHIDYWDSGMAFFARLPGLGAIIRLLAARLRVTPATD